MPDRWRAVDMSRVPFTLYSASPAGLEQTRVRLTTGGRICQSVGRSTSWPRATHARKSVQRTLLQNPGHGWGSLWPFSSRAARELTISGVLPRPPIGGAGAPHRLAAQPCQLLATSTAPASPGSSRSSPARERALRACVGPLRRAGQQPQGWRRCRRLAVVMWLSCHVPTRAKHMPGVSRSRSILGVICSSAVRSPFRAFSHEASGSASRSARRSLFFGNWLVHFCILYTVSVAGRCDLRPAQGSGVAVACGVQGYMYCARSERPRNVRGGAHAEVMVVN
jgi:hypothetical protein